VTIRDAYSNTVTADNRTITLTLLNANGATLAGTASLLTVSGVASWTSTQNLNIQKVGTGYQLRAAHSGAAFGGTDTVDSATFDITPGTAHHLAFSTQPTNTAAGAALLPQVTIQDQYNNTVTGDNRTISLSLLNANGATLAGTASLLTVSGVATWTGTENRNITKTGTGYQLRAAHDGASFGGTNTVDSSTFSITPAVAHHLAFTVEPVDTTAGQPLLPGVTILDQFDNTVTNDNRTISLTLLNAGGAVLAGTTSKLTTSGVATWTSGENLNIQTAGTGYQLRAGHSGTAFSGSDNADSAAFAITAETTAHHVAFTVQPVTGAAGAALGGTLVSATTGGGATWSGAQSLNITAVAAGYQLRATGSGAFSGSSTADSDSFDIVPAVADHLLFTLQPANAIAGVTLTPQVTIRDVYENPVTGDNRTITLTLLNAGGATLGGTASLLTTGGVATWTSTQGLNIQKAGSSYQLRAGHSGAAFASSDTVDSSAFNITPEGSAHHLEFTVQPTNTAAGAALLPQVTIRDQFNNTVTADDRDITLTFAANPGGAAPNGTAALTTTSGVATWLAGLNLNIATAAGGYQLRATGSGSFGGAATIDSDAFDIAPTGLHHFDVVAGTNPVTVGQVVTLTVTARDVHGNAIPSYTTTNAITLSTNTAGAGDNLSYTNGPGTLVDHHDGTATIGTGSVFNASGQLHVDVGNQRAETISVTVADGVANSGTVSVVWTASGTLNNFLLQAAPTSVVANAATTLTLTARDLYNNPIPSFTTSAPITIATNTGGDGSNLDYGCVSPSFVDNGAVATLSTGTAFNSSGQLELTLVDRRAETITITASDSVASDGSANVTWTPAAALLLEIQPILSQIAGEAFSVTIHLTDQFHNLSDVVADTDIELAVAAGDGALGGTTTGTLSAGTHSVTIAGVTYDRAENGVTLAAHRTSGDFLVSGTSNAFNVTGAAATKLAFDPAVLGNQVAGQAFSVTVAVLDSLNNPSLVSVDTGRGSIGGVVSGTLAAGTSRVTITGVTYDMADTGVSLSAQCTSGDALAPANTNLFSVSPGTGVGLRFVVQPTNIDVITPLAVSVEIIDPLGNRAAAADPITLSLVAPTGCGGSLAGTTTVGAVNGLATFGSAEDVVIRQICADYRLRASAPRLGAVDSEPFKVSAGTNLAVARLSLNTTLETTELVLTYTITGALTVQPFFITYGLKHAAASLFPLDQVMGYSCVNAAADRTPDTHTRSLGNIRASLDDAGIRNGDRVVVLLNPNGMVVESDTSDNAGAVMLAVDLALDAVVLYVRAGVSSVRMVYSVSSPARVPDFVIRAGFDANSAGTSEDTLPDFTARGSDATPGTHVLTFDLSAALLGRQTQSGSVAPFLVILDALGQVIESDETGNNQRSATAQGYPALAVALTWRPDYVVAGDELECTWRIRNDGIAAATGVVLRIPIPPGTQFTGATRLGPPATTGGGSTETPLNAYLQDGAALIAVDRLDPGSTTDVAVAWQVLAPGTVTVQASVTADGDYVAWSDAAEIEAAEPGTAPADMLVEDSTTTVQYTGLCGWVGPFTLSACLASLLGVRVRYRAARRGTRR
jgi:hypothetical protein